MENSKNVCPAFILNKGSAIDGRVHHADRAGSQDGRHGQEKSAAGEYPEMKSFKNDAMNEPERTEWTKGKREKRRGKGVLMKLNNTQRNGKIKERERAMVALNAVEKEKLVGRISRILRTNRN